ncbi:AT15369p [Strongyloides ratti]|uniref:AT15369p n=1 Tax=Strongyloides ratti TaxID=34506 RepID=A0A090LKV8_STRRB|nr:AT15369p [Strongyloides ratti]CEF68793.1 AT15369p [Strongyloides ratti]
MYKYLSCYSCPGFVYTFTRIFLFSSSSSSRKNDEVSEWKDYGSYGFGDKEKIKNSSIKNKLQNDNNNTIKKYDDDSFIPYSEWQLERKKRNKKYNQVEGEKSMKTTEKHIHFDENNVKNNECLIIPISLNISNIPEAINEEIDDMTSFSTTSNFDNQENLINSLKMSEKIKEVNGRKINHESRLRVISLYNERKSQVEITIVEGIHMPFDKSQIRVSFIGNKILKVCTPFKEGWNPKFNQTFYLNLENEDLNNSVILFRIYTKSKFSKSIDTILKVEAVEVKTLVPDEINVLSIAECTLPLSLVDIKDGSETLHNLKLHAVQEKNRGSVPNINIKEFDRMTVGQRKRSNSASGNNLKLQAPITSMRQNLYFNDKTSPIPPSTPKGRGSIFERNNNMHTGNGSRRGSTVDESGRFCSLPMNSDTKAELLVTLCYTSSSGQLVVGIEKASASVGAWGIKPPETFVKVTVLTQFQEEIGKQKTNVVKESFTPIYDSTFAFEIPKADIESHSLLLQVFTHCGLLRRKALLGQVILGEAASSPEAQDHWDDMIKGDSITLSKWHTLQGRDEINVSKGGTLKPSTK